MPDPRVARTQSHVLATVRRLLAEQRSEPLNFSVLAMEADVSRRTLYTHWGTMENVIAAAVATPKLATVPGSDTASLRERLLYFLDAGRAMGEDVVTLIALTKLMDQATQSALAEQALVEFTTSRIDYFRSAFGPITTDQYSRLVGPIYFSSALLRTPLSDDALTELVELACSFLDDADNPRQKITL